MPFTIPIPVRCLILFQNISLAQIRFSVTVKHHFTVLHFQPIKERAVTPKQQLVHTVSGQVIETVLSGFIGNIDIFLQIIGKVRIGFRNIGVFRLIGFLRCGQLFLYDGSVHFLRLDGIVELIGNGFQLRLRHDLAGIRISAVAEGTVSVNAYHDHGVFLLGNDLALSLAVQCQQQLRAARSGVIPLLIGINVHSAGGRAGEIVLPGVAIGRHQFTGIFGHKLKIHAEIVGQIEHSRHTRNLRAGIREQQRLDAGFLQENVALIPLEGYPFLQQLQIVLCGDLVHLVHHFLGIAAVGVLVLVGNARNVGFVGQQRTVRVVALLKFVPFLQRLLDGVAAAAVGRYDVHALFHRVDGLALVVKTLGVGRFADGHILQTQGVHDPAAHQQQRRGNGGGDQQRPAQASPFWRGRRGGFFNVAAVNAAHGGKHIFSCHTAIPSCIR